MTKLKPTLKYTKSSEITMLIDDFNAKFGNMKECPITGKYGIGVRNGRGNRLVEFCKGKELIITHTMYQHHVRNLYSWKYPGDKVRNPIDYIMIGNRHTNSVVNV